MLRPALAFALLFNAPPAMSLPKLVFFACTNADKNPCAVGTVSPDKPSDAKLDLKGAGNIAENAVAVHPNGHWVAYWEGPGLRGAWPGESFGGDVNPKILFGQAGKGLVSWTGLGKDCLKAGNVLSYGPAFTRDGAKALLPCAYGDGIWVNAYDFGSKLAVQPKPVLFKGKQDSKAAFVSQWALSADGTKIAHLERKGIFVGPFGANKPEKLPTTVATADHRILLTDKHVLYKHATGAKKYQLVAHDVAAKKSQVVFTYTEGGAPKKRESAPDTNLIYDKAGNAVYFLDVREGERGEIAPLYRLDLATLKATKVMDGVHDIFGVSGDGRYFAYAAPKNPGAKPDMVGSINSGTPENPDVLGVFDMQSKKGTSFALPAGYVRVSYAAPIN